MEPLPSWFAVPVGHHGRDGRIVVGSTAPRRFSCDEVAFVEAVADVLAGAADAYRYTESLRHQAWHDPLTGLSNRAALDARLKAVTADEVPIGVLVCDLDGLKRVNDRFGHRHGDELLVATAQRIRAAARAGDLVARTGGDEFVVVCSVVSADEAEAIAQRIHAAAAAPLLVDGYDVTTSVSVGIAMSKVPGSTADLMDRADAAMYRSKQQRGSRRRRYGCHPAGTALDRVPGDSVVAGDATVIELFDRSRPAKGCAESVLVMPGAR